MNKNILKRLVIHPVAWIWDQIKLPVVLSCTFWIAGFGFYHGVIEASKIGELTLGKAIVVTLIDIKNDDTDETQ